MDHWMGGDPVRQLQQDRIDKKVREMVVNKTPGWVKACTDQQRRQEKERQRIEQLVAEQRTTSNALAATKKKINDHYSKAEKWFKMAADRGHVESMKNYGFSLVRRGEQEGNLVLQRQGFAWVQRSENNGSWATAKGDQEHQSPPSLVSPRNSAIDYNLLGALGGPLGGPSNPSAYHASSQPLQPLQNLPSLQSLQSLQQSSVNGVMSPF